jgi:membrane-associated phospholipid phosphatase
VTGKTVVVPPPLQSPSKLRAFLRRRFTREGTLGLYLTVGFLTCALLVVLISFVLDEATDLPAPTGYDRSVTLALRDLQTPALTRIFRAVTNLGDYRFLVPATLVASGALVFAGRRVSALLFLGSVVGGFALESILKIAIHRSRPDLWPALVAERTFSFPSGHATMCSLFFGGVAAVVLHVTRRQAIRVAAIVAAVTLIVAVDFSRLYLGAHWLTDVVAGTLLGLFWVVICATGTEYFARRGAVKR